VQQLGSPLIRDVGFQRYYLCGKIIHPRLTVRVLAPKYQREWLKSIPGGPFDIQHITKELYLMDLESVNELYQTFLKFTKDNPVFSGMIGLWGIGIITFFFRYVPVKVFEVVKRQLTTTMVINNQDDIYYSFLHWVSATNLRSLVRTLNINNGYFWGGKDDEATMNIGYGINIFFFGRRIFFMNRVQVEANNTFISKEQIIITLLGRNHKIFKKLLKTIKNSRKDKTKTDILMYKDGCWRSRAQQFKRDLSTVILENEIKDNIISHIDKFISNKDWYIENGIPYRTGILLQGPPGTGKTSLIKAICAKYDKPLYIINVSSMNDEKLFDAMSLITEGSIIAIEDIDTVSLDRKKTKDEDKDKDDGDGDADIKLVEGVTLGGLLNAIDGVASNEDRIIIATTNHPEKLDAALIREGRFDLKKDLGYLNNETFREYINRFYPESNLDGWSVKPDVPACRAQKVVFDNFDNLKEVLNELAIKKSEPYFSSGSLIEPEVTIQSKSNRT
jgi:hypothetical protein